MINNVVDLWYGISGTIEDEDRARDLIAKAVYRYTGCGAWIDFEGERIQVGSIVEGVDECTEALCLAYPFPMDRYWAALDEVDRQADEIWNRTHGCAACWPDGTYDEWGNELSFPGWPVNPECKVCGGEGTII